MGNPFFKYLWPTKTQVSFLKKQLMNSVFLKGIGTVHQFSLKSKTTESSSTAISLP